MINDAGREAVEFMFYRAIVYVETNPFIMLPSFEKNIAQECIHVWLRNFFYELISIDIMPVMMEVACFGFTQSERTPPI